MLFSKYESEILSGSRVGLWNHKNVIPRSHFVGSNFQFPWASQVVEDCEFISIIFLWSRHNLNGLLVIIQFMKMHKNQMLII